MQYKRYRKATIFSIVIVVLALALIPEYLYLIPKYITLLKTVSEYDSSTDAKTSIEVSFEDGELVQELESVNAKSAANVRISVDSANVRTGPGTENDVIIVVNLGQEFLTTGNVQPASNGSLWYEIILDGENLGTGWVSEKVAEIVE